MHDDGISRSARHRPWFLMHVLRTMMFLLLFGLSQQSMFFENHGKKRRKDSCYSKEEQTEIVYRYKDMVYRYAKSQMKEDTLADEVFQETFLRLARQNKRFDSEEHLKAWLLTVCKNCCIDNYRSKWNKANVPYIDELRKDDSEDDNMIQTGFSQQKYDDPLGEQKLLAQVTYEAVEALPQPMREVVHLYYYENLSIREIAEITGDNENAVKTRMSRARGKLRQQLEETIYGRN